MSIAKYRKMRVKKDTKSIPGIAFVDEMERFKGKVIKVKQHKSMRKWLIGAGWTWHESWLEPIYKITLNTKKLY